MKVVTVKLKLYAATMQEIADLAEQFYGKVLQANGLSDSIDFKFEGPDQEHAESFLIILDSTFKKRRTKKAS